MLLVLAISSVAGTLVAALSLGLSIGWPAALLAPFVGSAFTLGVAMLATCFAPKSGARNLGMSRASAAH